MKTTEFRKTISGVANIIWFNSVEIDLTFNVVGLNKNFKGLATFHKFLETQISGWEKMDNVPKELLKSKNFFSSAQTYIEEFLTSYGATPEAPNLDSYWKNSVMSRINSINVNVITYDSSEAHFLINVNSSLPKSFLGAFTYLCGDLQQNINSKDNFNGYIMAYEFRTKDSKITERSKLEKKSFIQLRENFEKQLSELNQQLVSQLTDSDEKYRQYATKIDDFQTDKEKTYSDWFINAKGGFETFDGDSKAKIENLENTYKEKLKLEEPAKYWSERAVSLKKQGWISLLVLIGLIAIIVWSLGEILWSTPEQIYTSFFEGDKSAAIRWSIVYVTFISFMAFCVKAISKVMFSSFHLARDCEERYTLTYFYLSLSKDSTIDIEEKKLIMQSLFSRADTGLLKEDSSPAMPNDLTGKIFGGK